MLDFRRSGIARGDFAAGVTRDFLWGAVSGNLRLRLPQATFDLFQGAAKYRSRAGDVFAFLLLVCHFPEESDTFFRLKGLERLEGPGDVTGLGLTQGDLAQPAGDEGGVALDYIEGLLDRTTR